MFLGGMKVLPNNSEAGYIDTIKETNYIIRTSVGYKAGRWHFIRGFASGTDTYQFALPVVEIGSSLYFRPAYRHGTISGSTITWGAWVELNETPGFYNSYQDLSSLATALKAIW